MLIQRAQKAEWLPVHLHLLPLKKYCDLFAFIYMRFFLVHFFSVKWLIRQASDRIILGCRNISSKSFSALILRGLKACARQVCISFTFFVWMLWLYTAPLVCLARILTVAGYEAKHSDNEGLLGPPRECLLFWKQNCVICCVVPPRPFLILN